MMPDLHNNTHEQLHGFEATSCPADGCAVGRVAWRMLLATLFMVSLSDNNASGDEKRSDAEALKFFETKVRPLLVEHCVECHGQKKEESGLRLDSRQAVLRGGDYYGAAVVPGKPDKSPLAQVVGYENDIQMPPDEQLPTAELEVLRQWILRGAHWPQEQTEAEAAQPDPTQEWMGHWAAQPLERPKSSQVNWSDGSSQTLDQLVFDRLQQANLRPSPPADRRTLIRRATFDLIGLPPSRQEVDTFIQDESPDAFAKLVDRLLQSPHYGERWGRHWLDVARYADTKGYVRLQEEPAYHYAYSYRDYVVRSFNEDLPYDRFIIEQLAADLLDLGDDNRALAALGFLTLGRRFTSNKHDVIDDQIDVLSRGLLGLTVTCARCHDHKYDPIPTADYYSLYGVFASTREPANLVIVGVGKVPPIADEKIAEFKEKQLALDELKRLHHGPLLDSLRADTTAYLVKAVEGRKPFLVPLPAATGEIRRTFVDRWIDYIQSTSQKFNPVFQPWNSFAELGRESVPWTDEAVASVIKSCTSKPGNSLNLNPIVLRHLRDDPPSSMIEVAKAYGSLLTEVYRKWQSLHAEDPDALTLPDSDEEQLRQLLYAIDSPFGLTSNEAVADYLYDAEINKKLALAQNEFDSWLVGTKVAADRAHTLIDAALPHEPQVFVRGNPQRGSSLVPRRFLELLSDESREPYSNGSGRLDLAKEIASKNNPLTSRVLVNRVWMHHFGRGLVTTPSNFGLRGDAPSHPELLDYLAWRFTTDGWSVKKLHRLIMNSSTYQQSSDDRPTCREIDPDNRLLWKMNRRRLDVEAWRDSMLWAAGRIDLTVGGPARSITDPQNVRRTIYGTVDRLHLPNMFQALDFPSPDSHCSKRRLTTAPQQSLLLMNGDFALAQADALTARLNVNAETPVATAIERLYGFAFGRSPTVSEVKRASSFLQAGGSWPELSQALLASNEFLFVD